MLFIDEQTAQVDVNADRHRLTDGEGGVRI